MLDTVALYAQAGFCIFDIPNELRDPTDPNSWKQPDIKVWQRTPYDANADRIKHPGNFGVVVGQDHLVIDIDIKEGALGIESFKKLTSDAGLPAGWEGETYVVQTGTGGYHVYLKKPNAFRVRKNPKGGEGKPIYPGIDFLSGNAFVVGAGSIHPVTRNLYLSVIDDRSPNNVSPAPAAILSLIEKIEQVDLEPKESVVDDDPINIERFIEFIAELPQASDGNKSNACYSVACRGRDLGLSEATCASTLHSHYNGVKIDPAVPNEDITQIVRNAYKYAQGVMGAKNVSAIFKTTDIGESEPVEKLSYDKTEKGVIKPTLRNITNYIKVLPNLKNTFRFNEFTERVELTSDCPWFAKRGTRSDRIKGFDINLMKYHLVQAVNVEFADKTVESAIDIIGHDRHYHPVKNYLNSLVWDGKPRLDTWLIEYAGAKDNLYSRAIGRKTICAAVKRVFHPGCKFDYMLILEGTQGIGKSQLVTAIGKLWYGRMTLDPHHKDTLHKMKGKWIIEIAELNGVRWADANALKAFIDTQVDTARLSYEKDADDIFRQSIFIGTVNPEHVGYLADPTGNRRYWMIQTPGPIKLIDFENDLGQIYAEAMQAYEKEQLWLTGEASNIQVSEAKQRMPDEPYRVSVNSWLNANPTRDEASVIEILEFLGIPTKHQSKGDIARVANVLAEFGWDRTRKENHEIVYIRPLKERIERAMGAL